jgi:hypothetical protein
MDREEFEHIKDKATLLLAHKYTLYDDALLCYSVSPS